MTAYKGSYREIVDREEPKPIRSKSFNILYVNKDEEPKQYFHCATHQGVRMVRMKDKSFRCIECGSARVGRRYIYIEKENQEKA